MNKKKQLLQNTLIIAVGKLSTQIISYILLPLYTAALTPEEYGLYDYVVTVSTFVCPFITMLMENGMLRFLLDAKNKYEKKEIFTQCFIFVSIMTLLFIPIALIVLNNAHEDYSLRFRIIFILFIVSNVSISLSNSLARRRRQN